jgi:hypothetical protein
VKDISRRAALALLGSAPAAAAMSWTPAEAQQAHEHAEKSATETAKTGAPFKPKFFTAHEYATVTLLGDLIIPKDEKSGSASNAGVPQFIDFTMTDRPYYQTPMRGGLRWLDYESRERFGKAFVDCALAERTAILDDIAFQKKVKPELAQGAAFFSNFRDLVASGFFTSKIGIDDLQYLGNRPNAWNGCPPECLEHLGLKA